LTSASTAQQTARRYPPSIQVFSASGVDVIGTSTYITPEIRVGENAYVFAVMMDLDGQIRVLHPDFPGISVKLSAHKSVHLPNFFTGFNQYPNASYHSSARFQNYTETGGFGDTRGTVLALASRAPFDLEQLEIGGDWDMVAIRRLIEDRTPQSAMFELANYIGAKGEPIGRDFMRFSGGSMNAYADYGYAYSYSPCDFAYGYYGVAFAQIAQFNRTSNQRGLNSQTKIVGYDFCGVPIISYGPVVQGKFPTPGQPRSTGDTTVFPKSRFPSSSGTPPNRTRSASLATPEKVFPVTHRTGLPQMGDVTITAPKGRKAEPGQVLDGYRSQPSTGSAPQGRMPIDRTSYPRAEPTAATGGQPLREYHPEPRVESPPPTRMPERHDPPPPPREQPSSPPPRAETPTTKTEPLRPVPQNRQ
jgi:hypothetical protein